MRKLFDFSECMGDAPAEPEAPSSQEAWDNYYDDFDRWYYSCLAKLDPIIYPPNLPPVDEYEDNKGSIWLRAVSNKAVEFKLDFLQNIRKPKKYAFNSPKSFYITGIKISPKGNYSIITYGDRDISTQSLNRKKCKLVNIFLLASNHVKCPEGDLNKASKIFWNKLNRYK